jgi:hypothetical protein
MNMEDLLYEIHHSGYYDEVMDYVSELREKPKWEHREFKEVVERAFNDIKELKSADNKC